MTNYWWANVISGGHPIDSYIFAIDQFFLTSNNFFRALLCIRSNLFILSDHRLNVGAIYINTENI